MSDPYDNAGVNRQDYELPNCGSIKPHDQHFHSPIGGLIINCPGKEDREELMDREILQAIRRIVNYNWTDEERDFGEWPPPDPAHHIFTDLQSVDSWLADQGE